VNKKEEQIIYGRHPLVDAIRAGQSIEKILLQQGTRGEFEKELRQLTREHHIPVQVVPKDRLNQLVRGNHQGVVAFLSPIRYYQLEDLIPTIYEQSEVPLMLLLDGITDVRNMGAIARSAEICGAHAIVVPRRNSAQINAEAIKTSAGALTKIPVCRESSLVAAVDMLRISGIRLLVSDLKAERPIYDLDMTVPLALVAGAEGRGVSRDLIRAADETFIIPQRGTTDSFNVSVAAGIMLYEVTRQRGDAGCLQLKMPKKN
jgi:23S rRNA (guanosine2251-2'-O)-methyltransferase